MFLALNFFGGGPSALLDLHYRPKAHQHCVHVAKFHGDRLREFGGSPAKEIKDKKTSRVKHKAFGTNVPGGLII